MNYTMFATALALIARKGQILFDRAYGMANWDWRKPNATNTKFRLGSVTKQFTAAAILLLEERGKLRTEDPVSTHIPDAPVTWSKVTIRHLLHHESGIPDITGLPNYRDFKRLPHSPESIRQRFSDLPLLFEPGTKHRYSNSGYILLGQIIEKLSGETYESFLKKNLFDPAGMKDSGCDLTTKTIPNRAQGYVPTTDAFAPAPHIDMTVPGAAGNLYSTTHDLLRWEQALLKGNLLKPASLAKMLAPLNGITPSDKGIGMALAIDDTYGRKQIYFGGGVEGFNSWLAFDPADETVLILLSNVNTPWLEDISGQLFTVLHGGKVTLIPERKEIQLNEEVLQKYTGAYAISPTMNLNFVVENGKPYIQADGQNRLPMYAESPTRFFLRIINAQAEFVPNSRGSYDLIWTQSAVPTRAPKK